MTFLTQEPLISCDHCGREAKSSDAYPEIELETQQDHDYMDEPFTSESGWVYDTRLGTDDFGRDFCPDCAPAMQAAGPRDRGPDIVVCPVCHVYEDGSGHLCVPRDADGTVHADRAVVKEPRPWCVVCGERRWDGELFMGKPDNYCTICRERALAR